MYPIKFKRFTPPNGRWDYDEFLTPNKAIADKGAKLWDKGFTLTAEPLGMVGKFSFAIEGQIQYEEGDEPEQNDIAIEISNPGPDVEKAIHKLINNFEIPEDGIVRLWKKAA